MRTAVLKTDSILSRRDESNGAKKPTKHGIGANLRGYSIIIYLH